MAASIEDYLRQRYKGYCTVPTDFVFDELQLEPYGKDALVIKELVREHFKTKRLPPEMQLEDFVLFVSACI